MWPRVLIYGTIGAAILAGMVYAQFVGLGWKAQPKAEKAVAQGVRLVHVLFEESTSGDLVEVRAVVIEPGRAGFGIAWDVKVQPAGGVDFKALAQAQDARLMINGGFFDTSVGPVGLLIREGQTVQPISEQASLSGLVCISSDGKLVLKHREDDVGPDVREAIQAGPFLIDPGGEPGIHTEDLKLAQRSAIGISAAGEVVLLTASECTLYQFATILRTRAKQLGVQRFDRVLNLDGGPSSGLFIEGELNRPPIGPLHNVILFKD